MKQFDKKKNRKNSNSKKWDRYQSRDILPMWVADMDFESPACIKSELRKYVDNGIFGYHSEPKGLREILKKYLSNKGWNIKKEYSEEKVCSWKTIAASKDCDLEKDKGCKIVQPDKIGEEKFYLLEK